MLCDELRADIVRLRYFVSDKDIPEADGLDVFGLIELKKKLEKKLRDEAVHGGDIGVVSGGEEESLGAFRV